MSFLGRVVKGAFNFGRKAVSADTIGGIVDRGIKPTWNAAWKTVDIAGGVADVGVAAGKKMFKKDPNNFFGYKPNALGWTVGLVGIPGVFGATGVAGGIRSAEIGAVDIARNTGMVTEFGLTPAEVLKNSNIRPRTIDTLGADGELVFALHKLRNGGGW